MLRGKRFNYIVGQITQQNYLDAQSGFAKRLMKLQSAAKMSGLRLLNKHWYY